ncbi:uncharacterized protein BCR38DRAFT_377368 [Pseudomassariella vexata]|uniref:Rhodopsin domain-containing protein n=1 Tax=Pseudomassariella vexata TaxID=1141098 RepID=A0A1Y2DFR4_9PEZI|nr:uncharacterized protein BCR38DRAFT_377368 [Pseudomassariella vexata]ORY58037.1 hypothetical protein BCR38DRAFT_377368 [Pseudomassariella vexata]
METRQAECYAAVTVTLVAATIALCLRLTARRLKKISLWYDDWLIIGAFIAAVAYDAAEYKWLELGLGRHVYDLPIGMTEIRYYCSLFQWIMEHAYTVSITGSQLSLLVLYWRAFDSVHNVTLIIIALASCSSICQVFIVTFQCYPPQAKWDKSIEGDCPIDTGKFFLGTVTTHLILDVCLMILPASLIRTLTLPTIQKISISAMFMFGGVVCICSIMMILEGVWYDSHSNDVMWLETGPANWSAVEINLSIITACLPLLRPIFHFASCGFRSVHPKSREAQRNQAYKSNSISAFRHYARPDSVRQLGDLDELERDTLIHGQGTGPETKISSDSRCDPRRQNDLVDKVEGIRVTSALDFMVSQAA